MFEYVSLSVSTVLIPVCWTWGVLYWGDRLTAGFTDVLRHSPFFCKGQSQAQSSLEFSGRWRWRCGTWRKKIYPSGFITRVECIVVSRRVGRLPAVEGTHIYWRRWYGGEVWRLRWLRTIIVITCISSIICYRHRRQDFGRIGRQIQVLQAWGNNRELPSKTIWYRWLVRVVAECNNTRLRGCNRGYWWHPYCMMLRSLGWIQNFRRVVSSRSGFIRYLFYIEHTRVKRIKRDIWWHIEWREKNWIIIVEAADLNRWRLVELEWSVLRVMRIHFPEAGFRLMFPYRCWPSMKCRKSRVQLKLMRCKQISIMESLNLTNTWVWFLNLSLKMHADVIAGRQINQAFKWNI